MMSKVRVLDRPKDYKRFNLDPDKVQLFEDSRRGKKKSGVMENWYFDAILDDGSTVVLSFRPKNPADIMQAEDSPNLNIHITTPNGKNFGGMIMIPADEAHTGDDGNGADLKYGPHTFKGDLKDYDIHVEPTKDAQGAGCDLHFHTLVEPFRPGTGYIEFSKLGKNVADYTWFCFPKGEVTGTLTADGKTWKVKGVGYHDHQWPNKPPFALWHHWLWGRSNTGKYTFAMFDLVASKLFDYQWIPGFGLEDENGKLIFENTSVDSAEIEVLERYTQEKTGKVTPKKIKYTFKKGEDVVRLTVEWKKEIEVRASDNILLQVDDANREKASKMMKKFGIKNPSYTRYLAQADLDFTIAGKHDTQSSEMIYEYAYFGEFNKDAKQ